MSWWPSGRAALPGPCPNAADSRDTGVTQGHQLCPGHTGATPACTPQASLCRDHQCQTMELNPSQTWDTFTWGQTAGKSWAETPRPSQRPHTR